MLLPEIKHLRSLKKQKRGTLPAAPPDGTAHGSPGFTVPSPVGGKPSCPRQQAETTTPAQGGDSPTCMAPKESKLSLTLKDTHALVVK